jgi:hypothetical protein
MKRATLVLAALMVVALLLMGPVDAQAAIITGQQISANEWTYDLTFAPLDNYSIFQPTTTITLTGLFGVVNAEGPTSTDFPPGFLDTLNLDWTAAVLNGGTEVQWTHVGGGTGNFSDERHIFGFRVFADGATNGLVSLMTSGLSRDTNNPLPNGTFNLDITESVAGPTAPPPTKVPEPSTLALLSLGGVALAGWRGWRKRSATA